MDGRPQEFKIQHDLTRSGPKNVKKQKGGVDRKLLRRKDQMAKTLTAKGGILKVSSEDSETLKAIFEVRPTLDQVPDDDGACFCFSGRA